jgi:DNA repair protein SbcC/Rad50
LLEIALLKNQVETHEMTFRNLAKDVEISESLVNNSRADFVQKAEILKADFGRFSVVFDWKNRVENLAELRQKMLDFEQKSQTRITTEQDLILLESNLKNLESKLELARTDSLVRQKMAESAESETKGILASRQILFGDKIVSVERIKFSEAFSGAESLFLESQKELKKHLDLLQNLRQTVVAKRQFLHENEQQKAEFEQKLNQKLSNTSEFDSMISLQNAVLPEPESSRLEVFFQNLANEDLRLDQSDFELKTSLETHQQITFSEQNLEVAKQNLATGLAEFQQLSEKIGGIKNKIDNQKNQQEKAGKVTQLIDKQQVTYKRWSRLSDEIGSSDGTKFRKFAQGLTLKRLVVCANKHLEKLHGRYIIRVSAEEDLEMEIIDTFLGNSARKMKSLSGGESFLVSLSLALGLADLAGRKAQIRSLFIDEGFGALDENALSTAISTLENLQTEGIQIGIVSHVKELKERIFPQILVKKMADGSSKIEIIDYFDV